MGKLFIAISALTLFLTACDSQPEPKNYVFDKKLHSADIQKYTISDNEMAQVHCKFGAIIFMKETLQAFKEGKKLKLEDMDKLITPATIKVYDDKIEWVDVGEETPIVNNVVVLPNTNTGDKLPLAVIRDGESFSLRDTEKEAGKDCIFPFKKIEG